MPAELRVAVVGAGWAGVEHCGSIASLGAARVCAVVDLDAARGCALADELGARFHPDVDTLLDAEPLDAVIVATPPGSHREPAVAALERGIGVLIEKPLARSAEDGRAIAEAARRTGAVCAVGYQWRALEPLQMLQSRLADQPPALLISHGVGITQARSWFTDTRQSGGLISERASHHIDLQRAVAGEVMAVQAMQGDLESSCRPLPPGGFVAVVTLTLRFASGALGAIHVGWTAEGYPGRQQLAVFARDAAYDLDLDPVFALRGRSSGAPLQAGGGEHPFRREMRLCLDAVREGEPDRVACDATEAAGSLFVALAAEQAVAHGGTVLPESLDRDADAAPAFPDGAEDR